MIRQQMCALSRTGLLLLLVSVLFPPVSVLGQVPTDIDVSWALISDGEVEFTCYQGSTQATRFFLLIEDGESGARSEYEISPGIPLMVGGLDSAADYVAVVEGRDDAGFVLEFSPPENFRPEPLANVTAPSDADAFLSLKFETLDPSLCPLIYSTVEVDGLGEGVVLGQDDFEVYEDDRLQTDMFQVEPPLPGGGSRIVDMVFIVDNSGSMGNEQNQVRAALTSFANQLELAGMDYRLGLVRFGQSGSGNPILVNGGTMTGSASDFISNYLNQLTARGGTEPGIAAVLSACRNFAFRPGSQRHFLLITDEDSDGGSMADAASCCLANNITVHAAVDCNWGSSRSHYCYSGSIRDRTGGDLYNVTGPYDDILDDMIIIISKKYTVSYRTDNPCANGGEREVRIQAEWNGLVASDTGAYTPGTAPRLSLTEDTQSLLGQQQVENQPIGFSVLALDASPPYVSSVTMFYRTTGTSDYASVSMSAGPGDIWTVELPGSAIASPGLDFYFKATDGEATVTLPHTDPNTNPCQFAVRPNVAPRITHTPQASVSLGQDVIVTAEVLDSTDFVQDVVLYYKELGDLRYFETPMAPIGGDKYSGTIPASITTALGVEYEIRAVDNLGVGSVCGPHSVLLQVGPTCWTNGQIEICGDLVASMGNGIQKVSGNVTMNDILRFSGDVLIDESALTVSGEGRIYLTDIPMPWGNEDVTIYDGGFSFSADGTNAALADFVEENLDEPLRVGGLKVKLSEIELLLVDQGIRIAGEIELPPALKSLKVDIEDLVISRASGIDVAACLSGFPEIKLGKVGVHDLELCYDSLDNCFSGQATADIKVVSIGGEAEVCEGKLRRIGLEVEVSPGVPIATTGFNLTGGSGLVDFGATPVLVRITVDITGGPQVGGINIVKFDDMGLTIQYPDEISGGGDLYIFAQKTASGVVAYGNRNGKKSFKVAGNLNLVDIVIVDVNARVDREGFWGSAEGIVQVPAMEGFPFDLISTVLGLPYELAGMTEVIDNNSIEGEYRLNLLLKKITIAHRILFTPELEVYFGTNFDNLREITLFYAGSEYLATAGEGSHVFNVPQNTPLVVFEAKSASGPPDLTAIAPNGEVMGPGNSTAIAEGRMAYLENPDLGVTFIMVKYPLEGDWLLQHPDGLSDVTVSAHRQHPPTRIAIETEETGSGLRILSDVRTEGAASLRLFFDDDRQGLDGEPIVEWISVVEGIHEHIWSPADLPSGEYYVYAVLKDPDNAPVFAYSESAFMHLDPMSPDAPANLRSSLVDGVETLEWDPVIGVEGYAVRYGRSGEDGYPETVSLLEDPLFQLGDIVPGQTYRFVVQAYGLNERWGAYSEPLILTLETEVGNNSPEIISHPPERVLFGQDMVYEVAANDADGDPLAFSLEGALPGMSLNGNVLIWSPRRGMDVMPPATVVVEDGNGGTDRQVISTAVYGEDFGEASLDLDRRIYAGIGIPALAELFDQDIAPESPVSLAVRCDATGDELAVECIESKSGAGLYTAEIGFETSAVSPGLLHVTEGAVVSVSYLDLTTGENIEAEAIWVSAMPLQGSLDIDPDTVNQTARGNWVTVYYEPPAPYLPEMVDPTRILLGGALKPDLDHVEIADNDGDGIMELALKFDRERFQSVFELGEQVELTMLGALYTELATLPVRVGDVVRIINPHITRPVAGSILDLGTPLDIAWDLPDNVLFDGARISISYDGGSSWQTVADIAGQADGYSWDSPDTPSSGAYLMVDLFNGGLLVGSAITGPLTIGAATAVPDMNPKVTTLYPCYPNPFNPQTVIRYYLPDAADVDLRVYDVRGKLVRRLYSGMQGSGEHRMIWRGLSDEGETLSSGAYFVSLVSGGKRITQQVLLLK